MCAQIHGPKGRPEEVMTNWIESFLEVQFQENDVMLCEISMLLSQLKGN